MSAQMRTSAAMMTNESNLTEVNLLNSISRLKYTRFMMEVEFHLPQGTNKIRCKFVGNGIFHENVQQKENPIFYNGEMH